MHPAPDGPHSGLEPQLLHVICHRAQRHRAAHHVHRRPADESSAEHQRVGSVPLDAAGHLEAFVQIESAPESVPHVRLHDDGHVVPGRRQRLAEAHVHETHPVLERAAVFVFAAVRVRRQELADQVVRARRALLPSRTLLRGPGSRPCRKRGPRWRFRSCRMPRTRVGE